MHTEPDSVILAAIKDRRAAPRDPTRPKAVTVTHEATNHAATLINISRSGLKFRSRFAFPCGAEVKLSPPSNEIMVLSDIAARVHRCEIRIEDGEEVFEHGARFSDTNNPARHAWYLALRQPEESESPEKIRFAS